MKRDMGLIKQILKFVEREAPGEHGILFAPDIQGFTGEQVEYHVSLCFQAGYVAMFSGHIENLTWLGHNELDRLRTG